MTTVSFFSLFQYQMIQTISNPDMHRAPANYPVTDSTLYSCTDAR